MVDVQTVSIAIASASIVVAVIYYILQIRNQSKMRNIDLVLRLDLVFEGNEFKEALYTALERDVKEYDTYSGISSKWRAESKVCGFFETVGFLLRRKLVDLDFACTAFPTIIVWEKLRFFIEKVSEYRHRHAFQNFEYLYNETKKYEQKKEQQLQLKGAQNG
jgi:hypothetical protein